MVSTNIDRLFRVHPREGLLLAANDLHDQWRGQALKLLGHYHLVEVRLLHHKVEAVFLGGERAEAQMEQPSPEGRAG